MERIVAALIRETELRQNFFNSGTPINSIYFGGGTPSLLGLRLSDIMNACQGHFRISAEAEVTLEANPDDVTPDSLLMWEAAGVTRISLGVQSFDNKVLNAMNRAHDRDQALKAMDLLSKSSLELSADLIFGWPGQELKAWQTDLDQMLAFAPEHMSCYRLTVEARTALHFQVQKGQVLAMDADATAPFFLHAHHHLRAAGYHHYEISNYAKPGYRAKHNSGYWSGQAYLGIGPSAHSFDGNQQRSWNVRSNPAYVKAIEFGSPPLESEVLTPEQRAIEIVMTRLRTFDGLDLSELDPWQPTWPEEIVRAARKWRDTGHVHLKDGHLTLSVEGMTMADTITVDLLP